MFLGFFRRGACVLLGFLRIWTRRSANNVGSDVGSVFRRLDFVVLVQIVLGGRYRYVNVR